VGYLSHNPGLAILRSSLAHIATTLSPFYGNLQPKSLHYTRWQTAAAAAKRSKAVDGNAAHKNFFYSLGMCNPLPLEFPSNFHQTS
jgi:hypothetical protein